MSVGADANPYRENQMTNYTVTFTDGDTFTMVADMAQASAPIKWLDSDGDICHTQHQTADARHCEFKAAQLLAEGFGYYADDVQSVEEVGGE